MLESHATLISAAELLLLLGGCVLLWRHGLRPAARRQQPLLPAWEINAGDFLLYLWLVICGGLLLQLGAWSGLKESALEQTARLILAGASFHVGMLLGVAGFRLLRKPAPAVAPVRSGSPLPAALVTFALALPVITAVSLLWQLLLSAVGLPAEPQDLIALFAQAESPWLLALMISVATLLAPATEELVFRAGLFRYTRTRLPRWLALILPSCLFASLHANLASFAPLAVLGIIFSLAYERTGRIAVPIIAHGLFNLNTIVLILAGVGL